jgi:hypothetical protein
LVSRASPLTNSFLFPDSPSKLRCYSLMKRTDDLLHHSITAQPVSSRLFIDILCTEVYSSSCSNVAFVAQIFTYFTNVSLISQIL